MTKLRTEPKIDIKQLYENDKELFSYSLKVIENLKKKKLTKDKVMSIYENGIPLSFIGKAPIESQTQNYFLFYRGMSSGKSERLKVDCDFSRSDHLSLIVQGNPIVGGTLQGKRFDSFSATWLKNAPYRSTRYRFGEVINDIMLKHFNLK